jgi:hypothetical protein
VAISSGNAMRRKSASLSEPRFWNGKTATVVSAAGPLAGATRRLEYQMSVATTTTPIGAAAKTATFLVRLSKPAGGFEPTAWMNPDPELESRLARLKSAFISEACW